MGFSHTGSHQALLGYLIITSELLDEPALVSQFIQIRMDSLALCQELCPVLMKINFR